MQFRAMAGALTAVGIIFGAGCAKTPEPSDVVQYLASTLGDETPYRVAQLVLETEPAPDGKFRVKFKADLRTDETLYVRVSAADEMEKLGWKEAELDSAVQSAGRLPTDLAEKVSKDRPQRAAEPVLLKQSVGVGETRMWNGVVEGKHIENRWSFSNLSTEKRDPFQGDKKAAFPPNATMIGTPEASKALADAIAVRKRYVEAVASAEATLKDRVSRGQTEKRTVVEAKARQAAEREALERNTGAAGRKAPVRVGFRRASMGRGAVALVQNASTQPLELKLMISDGRKAVQRLIRIGPLATIEIGLLQGWDFKSGDVLTFEHLQYLPAKFRVP